MEQMQAPVHYNRCDERAFSAFTDSLPCRTLGDFPGEGSGCTFILQHLFTKETLSVYFFCVCVYFEKKRKSSVKFLCYLNINV